MESVWPGIWSLGGVRAWAHQKTLIFGQSHRSSPVDSPWEIDILTDLHHDFVHVWQGIRSAESLTL